MNMHAPILTPREMGRRLVEEVCEEHWISPERARAPRARAEIEARDAIVIEARLRFPTYTQSRLSRITGVPLRSVQYVLARYKLARETPDQIDPGSADIRAIIDHAARTHGGTVEIAMSRRRDAEAVRVRHACIRALAEAMPAMTASHLGRVFGLHHATILFALGVLSGKRPKKLEAA